MSPFSAAKQQNPNSSSPEHHPDGGDGDNKSYFTSLLFQSPRVQIQIQFPREITHEHDEHEDQNWGKKSIGNSKNHVFAQNRSWKKKGSLHRCKTAPTMTVMRNLKPNQTQNQIPKLDDESSSILELVLLAIYLSLGVTIYSFNTENFSGIETHPAVDALYFCIVTMCTIGYGDIASLTPATKLFGCLFVLVGFWFIDILLSGVVNYVLVLQENMILAGITHETDERNGLW